MTRMLAFVFALLPIAAVAAGAETGDLVPAPEPLAKTAPIKVILEDEVYVRGPKVRLGEVARFEGAAPEELSNLELVSAPLPGSSTRVQAALIETRIRNAGWADPIVVEGADIVEATTLHQEIVATQLAEDLRKFVLFEMPWDPADATVDIVGPTYSVVVPDGQIEIAWKANPRYEYLGNGAFRGEIYVDGVLEKTVQARANIEAYGPVVVAATDIPRGTLVSKNDVAIEMQALSRLAHGTITEPSAAIGQVARSTIFPGAVLTSRQVQAPKLVRRHQTVTVVYRQGGLEVRTSARCEDNGSAGDVVTCTNTETKEKFHGVVLSDGTVRVQ